MTLPTIEFVGMTPSPALRVDIERQVLRLSHLAPRMTSCHITLRRAEGHQHKGHRFHVQARAVLPGGTFDVGRGGSDCRDCDDAYAAVRNAFNVLRRQIEEFQSIRQSHRQDGHSQDAA